MDEGRCGVRGARGKTNLYALYNFDGGRSVDGGGDAAIEEVRAGGELWRIYNGEALQCVDEEILIMTPVLPTSIVF